MIHDFKKLVLLGLVLATGTNAEESIPFSGIAFMSELGDARESMPYTFDLIGNCDTANGRAFFKSLCLAADGRTLKNGDALSSQKENSLGRGQAPAIALAIENEKMNETRLNANEYQLAFNLDAKILALLDQIVSQLEKPDKKWAEEHAAGNAKARDIVKTFKNVKTLSSRRRV